MAGDQAMWAGSPEDVEWQRQERQRRMNDNERT